MDPGPAGRREAEFEALVSQYRDKVFRLIFSIVRATAPAEDLAQEVFLKIWRALDRYDGRASMSTWIYVIARNTALAWLRAEGYRRTEPLDPASGPVSHALHQMDHQDIRTCVARLPDDQRQIVEQYYFQDRSIEDVAEVLGLPSGTVKSHLFRARRALAAMLGGEE